MKVDLDLIDIHRLGFSSPILLFRQEKTAEETLELARQATTEGRVSTDLAEILQATKNRAGLKDLVESGQIVGVILDK